MDVARIAQLLAPFAPPLGPGQLSSISIYIDILTRWNARMNLTAVRDPQQMVTRHFGESLFAAALLFPSPSGMPAAPRLVDVGSGAGFPGLPVHIWAPQVRVTLIESNHKKATFLREVVRTLTLTDVDVFPGRAQQFAPASGDVVTLRAVERFEQVLPGAAALVSPGGRLALLVGAGQVAAARDVVPAFAWDRPLPVPLSSSRVVLVGTAA